MTSDAEDADDVAAFDEAMAEGGDNITWEQVMAEILSDRDTPAAIEEGREEAKRGKTVTLEELRRDLDLGRP